MYMLISKYRLTNLLSLIIIYITAPISANIKSMFFPLFWHFLLSNSVKFEEKQNKVISAEQH